MVNFKKMTVYLLIIIITLSVVSAIAHTEEDTGVKVPIIMYHSILKNNPANSQYIVSPDMLESDLIFLKNNGYTTITVGDLINYVYNHAPLPEKPIILTFDDGHYNNYHYAYPLMKKYNMKMVISVVGCYTDQFSESDGANPNYSYLTWDEIAELQGSGYAEIQSHTYSMHSLSSNRLGCMKNKNESTEEYQRILYDDLLKLQEKLKNKTGSYPTAFTYPFGKVCKQSYDVIKKIGFKASFSCAEGTAEITRDPECLYLLKRYIRPPDKGTSDYFDSILH